MNAKDALTLSKSCSMDEIASIVLKIENACKNGKTSIRTEDLNDATIEWLKENGYKYESIKSYGGYQSGYFRISW